MNNPCNCGDALNGAKLYQDQQGQVVRAKKMDRSFVVSAKDGLTTAEAGQYYCEDAGKQRWAMNPDVFERVYQPYGNYE